MRFVVRRGFTGVHPCSSMIFGSRFGPNRFGPSCSIWRMAVSLLFATPKWRRWLNQSPRCQSGDTASKRIPATQQSWPVSPNGPESRRLRSGLLWGRTPSRRVDSTQSSLKGRRGLKPLPAGTAARASSSGASIRAASAGGGSIRRGSEISPAASSTVCRSRQGFSSR